MPAGRLLFQTAKEFFDNYRLDGIWAVIARAANEFCFSWVFNNWDKYVGRYPELVAIFEKYADIEPIIVKKINRKKYPCRKNYFKKLATMIGMGNLYMETGKPIKAIREYENTYAEIKKSLRIR